MELLVTLRVLRQRPALVAMGAIVAIGAALAVLYQVSLWPPALTSRQHTSGHATAQVLVDRPHSLLADSAPNGADPIESRALLIANLMASAPVKQVFARDAGLASDELTVVALPTYQQAVSSPLVERVSAREAEAPGPYAITARADGRLPLVTIDASAPDASSAAALVAIAERGLASLAASQNTAFGRLVATPLGTPQVSRVRRGPQRGAALAVSVTVFCLWCVCIAVGTGMADGRRRARADDMLPA